jgi:hypothetical protein
MVHSAFVPGVTAIYDELLGEGGQEIIRLELDERAAFERKTIGFEDLRRALAERGCIPLAIELDGGSVHLNPPKGERFAASTIAAIYAIAGSRDAAD